MSSHAKLCPMTVLACPDFRNQKKYSLYEVLHLKYGDDALFDQQTAPGVCFQLVRSSPEERKVLLKWLAFLVDKHTPETIVVVQHMGCAQYHDAMTFHGARHEHDVLVGDFDRATHVLREAFPKLTIHGYIAHMSDADVVAELETIGGGTSIIVGRRAPLIATAP